VGGQPTSPTGFPDSAGFFSFAAFAWLARRASPDGEGEFWKAVWPVFAYTAQIYWLRYTPNPPKGSGAFADYKWNKMTGRALTSDEIEDLRQPTMKLLDFVAIVKKAIQTPA
jgi:hypothetical protein